MIELGDKVKDKVTGLVGIATSRIEYLNGCWQIGVEPPVKVGGKLISHYIDRQQLVKVPGGLNDKPKAKKAAKKPSGATIFSRQRGGPSSSDGPSMGGSVGGGGESIDCSGPRADKYSEEH